MSLSGVHYCVLTLHRLSDGDVGRFGIAYLMNIGRGEVVESTISYPSSPTKCSVLDDRHQVAGRLGSEFHSLPESFNHGCTVAG